MESWLLDVYPSGEDEMTLWLKTGDGRTLMFKDDYMPTLYVHGSVEDLRRLELELEGSESARKWGLVERRVRLGDAEESKVLRIECGSMERFPHFARKLVKLGGYRDYHLYNVDIPHAQSYLREKGLFPLARVRLSNLLDLEIELLDSAESVDYSIPPLKYAWLSTKPEGRGGTATFDDPIEEISVSIGDDEARIDRGSEGDKILQLVNLVNEEDPDVIFTRGGDSWDMPYLAERAKAEEISDDLILGREPRTLEARAGGGTSYFSYGRVYYKPPPHHLEGRIHVDVWNSFIYRECGLDGLMELARMTRTPIQKMARSSIGSAMTNLQLYWALENGVLIPWTKREPENFKSAWKLLEADRGGFIFELRIGIHEEVGEIDFGSFYPAMMEKYNISPETILCDCCPDSRSRVPELGYNICERRRGLIPQVLKPVLEKRRRYKELTEEAGDEELAKAYDMRQEALKWILVTCFGYLGYRNARFGRIEAHEAVTAFARENLLNASRMAEEMGFEVVHGIVDSLWVKKAGLENSELESLCYRIEDEVGLPIRPEGKYKWIVFPPSRESTRVPVMNRYYGVFESGQLKVRGIMMRKRDTPDLIGKAQREMLERLSDVRNAKEFKKRIPSALEIVGEHADRLKEGNVRLSELAVRSQLSHHPKSYQIDARSAVAARQLMRAGVDLHAGQQVSYVVTNANADNPNLRVRPIQLLRKDTKSTKTGTRINFSTQRRS